MVPLAALFAAGSKNCGCACCKGEPVCCCHAGEKAGAAETYPLRGVVTAVRPDRAELTVKHEAIPDFMPAMTMVFKVDPETLPGLKAGQRISAVLFRRDAEYWLREVRVE